MSKLRLSTSKRKIAARKWFKRNPTFEAILTRLERDWEAFLSGGRCATLADLRSHMLLGVPVGTRAGPGVARDIDDKGRLIVALEGGGLTTVADCVEWPT